jgi:hypothetical protein
MTIDELLKEEKEYRKANKWLTKSQLVKADNGLLVLVHLKSYGFYNQILRFEENPINYCSGHTISKVKEMHNHLREHINLAANVLKTALETKVL